MVDIETRRRSRRLELRTTPDERDLIDRGAQISGSDLTEFVVSNAVSTARRLLAEREVFVLDAEQRAAWEALNDGPARDLPGIRALLERTSPFRP